MSYHTVYRNEKKHQGKQCKWPKLKQAWVALMEEHQTHNRKVMGSNPGSSSLKSK